MRTIKSLIIFLMIVCNFSAFAEGKIKDNDKEISAPKKTWKILVKNNLSADDNFALVGRTLAENDFTIDKKDKEFYTIKTANKEIGKSISGTYFLTFIIKSNTIAVTGQYNTGLSLDFGSVRSENEFEKIRNIGGRGSWPQKSFMKMHDFALLLGSQVEYITE